MMAHFARRATFCIILLFLPLFVSAQSPSPDDPVHPDAPIKPTHRALIVMGLGGDLSHAIEYAEAGSAIAKSLASLGYGDAVRLLFEDGRFPTVAAGAAAAKLSTERGPDGSAHLESIEAAFQQASASDSEGDILLVILSGHADASASSARPEDRGKWRLHLPGSDLSADRLRSLIEHYPGSVVLVAATPLGGTLGHALAGTRCALVTLCRSNQQNMLAAPSVLAPVFSSLKAGSTATEFTTSLRSAVAAWYKTNNFLSAETPDLNGDTRLFKTAIGGAPGSGWSSRALVLTDTSDPFSSGYNAASIASHALDADAVVLFRMIDISMDEEGNVTERHREVVRIQSPRARDAADVEFMTGGTDDTWSLVRAQVRRGDSVITIGSDAIYENMIVAALEKENQPEMRQVTIHPPGMEVGSVSDIEYVRRERRFSVNDEPGIDWPLVDQRPVSRLVIRVTVPKRMQLSIGQRRLPALKETEDRYSRSYSAMVENLPGIEFEPFSPPIEEIVPRLVIAKKETWEEIGRWYARVAEGALLPDSAVAAATKSVRPSSIEADVYDWVCRSIRYVSVPLGTHSYKPALPGGTLRRGFGDCKDKASLFVSALAAHGRRANMVLIGAGLGDVIEEVPRAGAFNHAIVAIPDGKGFLFADPTSEVAEYGSLPNMDEGRQALVVFADTGMLVRTPISPPERNRMDVERRALQSGGALVVTETRTMTGQQAFMARMSLRRGSTDQYRAALGQQIATRYGGAVLLDFKNANEDSATAPYQEYIRYQIPLAAGLLPVPMNSMILPSPPRRLPIQLPSTMLVTETTLLDRTGFETAAAPTATSISNAAGEASSSYEELAASPGSAVGSPGFLVAHRMLRLPARDMPAERYEDFRALVSPAPVFLGARLVEPGRMNPWMLIGGLIAAAAVGAVITTMLQKKRRIS